MLFRSDGNSVFHPIRTLSRSQKWQFIYITPTGGSPSSTLLPSTRNCIRCLHASSRLLMAAPSSHPQTNNIMHNCISSECSKMTRIERGRFESGFTRVMSTSTISARYQRSSHNPILVAFSSQSMFITALSDSDSFTHSLTLSLFHAPCFAAVIVFNIVY